MLCRNNGKKIYGRAVIPENRQKKLAAVILSHGYNSSCSDLVDAARYFAAHGIFAYCYDFCGGSSRSKSDGSSLEMSIETEKSDLTEVINVVKAIDFVNCDRVFLYGESQGGFVSALTAADMTDAVAGLFLIYPAFCIPDDWLRKNPDEMPESFDIMGMKLSRRYYDGVPRYDVFERVSVFDKPVLVFHGTADGLVNISYSEKLCKSFPSCRLYTYDAQGHGFSNDVREAVFGIITDSVCDSGAE